MNTQSYIIRIYRSVGREVKARRAHDVVALDGIIESPLSGEHQAFHDVEELWAILARNVLLENISRRAGKHTTKR